MGWVLVSVAGLAVETSVIIALGRQTTRRWEVERERTRSCASPALRVPSLPTPGQTAV